MSSPYLPAHHRPRLPLGWPSETWRLTFTVLAVIIGAITGLIVFGDGGHPLSGRGSIGEVTAVTAAALAVITFAVWYVWASRIATNRWRRRMHPLRRLVDLVGLSLIHSSIVLLGLSAAFWVAGQAFRELQLDRPSAATIVAVGAGIATYLIAGSALTMTTRSLSELIALFVLSGALSSMLTASDPLWWHAHLSQLGAAGDASGLAFNFTLALAGLVITTLSDFLTHDLTTWARAAGADLRKVSVVRVVFIVIGVFLSTLAFLPVDRFFIAHNVVAYTAVAMFGLLVLMIPIWFPSLSRAFSLVCWATVALLIIGLFMFFGLHYLNLTAFELIAVAGVFAWLILFIGSVDAAAAQVVRARRRSAAAEIDRPAEAELSLRLAAAEGVPESVA